MQRLGGTPAKGGRGEEGKGLQRRAAPTQVLGESGRLGGEFLCTLESPREKQVRLEKLLQR